MQSDAVIPIPYCGTPPSPADLVDRFNLDPRLLVVLLILSLAHCALARGRHARTCAIAGWAIASLAFVSPLCALSVSLFTARIAQHMILLLVAAPLIALALPAVPARSGSSRLWFVTCIFFSALWFWHMPIPYDATFASTSLYWLMHITLFGSAILLWRELLHHPAGQTGTALMAGAVTTMQMSLLGAMLTLASHPLFDAHITTTWVWGLSPLQDQALGGIIMWVPGMLLFLWTALRSLRRTWNALENARTQ